MHFFVCIYTYIYLFKNWLEIIWNNESKGSSIWVNIAYILHGTIYSIFAYNMRTVQSNFRNLIIYLWSWRSKNNIIIIIIMEVREYRGVNPEWITKEHNKIYFLLLLDWTKFGLWSIWKVELRSYFVQLNRIERFILIRGQNTKISKTQNALANKPGSRAYLHKICTYGCKIVPS